MQSLPETFLERAARVYKTNSDAAAAVGLSARGFARACRRYGIETPFARRQARRPPVRDGAH